MLELKFIHLLLKLPLKLLIFDLLQNSYNGSFFIEPSVPE